MLHDTNDCTFSGAYANFLRETVIRGLGLFVGVLLRA